LFPPELTGGAGAAKIFPLHSEMSKMAPQCLVDVTTVRSGALPDIDSAWGRMPVSHWELEPRHAIQPVGCPSFIIQKTIINVPAKKKGSQTCKEVKDAVIGQSGCSLNPCKIKIGTVTCKLTRDCQLE
jgi:hypothetical protein